MASNDVFEEEEDAKPSTRMDLTKGAFKPRFSSMKIHVAPASYHQDDEPARTDSGGAASAFVVAQAKQAKSAGPGLHRRASTGFVALPPSRPLARPSFGSIETYKKLEKLGEGTYATVFKGISAVNGKMVALKEIRLEQQEGAPCTAIREVSLLKGLKHANIVTLHDIIYNKTVLMLVFEYLEKDLKIYMDDCGSFIDTNNIRLFLFQLLRGLKFCHSRKVLHRDLKPQNLLINANGELKLADFGLARAQSVPIRTFSHEVVTLWYRPPDVLLGSVDYNTSIDMWGVGCIFYEMVSGRAIFPGADSDHQLRLIWHLLGTPDEENWPGVSQLPGYRPGTYPRLPRQDMALYVPRLDRAGLELLNHFLQYDPLKRASAAEALDHRYFDVLGPAARTLSNEASLFSLPEIVFKADLRVRPMPQAGGRKKGDGKRRSSVRF